MATVSGRVRLRGHRGGAAYPHEGRDQHACGQERYSGVYHVLPLPEGKRGGARHAHGCPSFVCHPEWCPIVRRAPTSAGGLLEAQQRAARAKHLGVLTSDRRASPETRGSAIWPGASRIAGRHDKGNVISLTRRTVNHPNPASGADNPASRYHALLFYLSTYGRAVPYK